MDLDEVQEVGASLNYFSEYGIPKTDMEASNKV